MMNSTGRAKTGATNKSSAPTKTENFCLEHTPNLNAEVTSCHQHDTKTTVILALVLSGTEGSD
jgi:hypothetical protein